MKTDEELTRIAEFIYERVFCRRVHKTRQLKWAYLLGMIPKSQLQDGATYFGTCRNSCTAIWNKETQEFDYLRGGNFVGDEFYDSIACAENAVDPEDIFIPMVKKTT